VVSSDVKRARDMLVAGVACALAVLAFALVTQHGRGDASPGALSRPHANAGLACAACHAKEDARASCTGCHDGAAHASTRPGHTRMRAEGAMTCADCHRAHGEGQTVAFESSGAWIRSGGGAEITGQLQHGTPASTVPLVPLSACARCHDLHSRTDPIATCAGPGPDDAHRAVTCMDEHKRAMDASESRRPAFGGSADHRFASWSAAAEIARTTPWVERTREARGGLQALGFLAAGLVASGGALALRNRKRAPKRSDPAPVAPATKKRLPMIDTSTCLGCHACVDACPFGVLEVQKFVAIVARPDDCCGVVSCHEVCPNGSLRIAEADAETPSLVDERLESVDVKGLWLAGDLTGMPLIKNALRQGTLAIDSLAADLPKKRSVDILDVVIVGAGPAGLAASLRAKERGLRYATLEQATIASSIRAFPRHKLVYDQPLHVPIEGELWMKECTKEELLMQWTRVARKHQLAIREQHRVTGIAREDDLFTVRAESGGEEVVLRARHVIVAVGRRGSPRKLDVEMTAGAESRVFYHLADARTFEGQRVLVVGLGDVAMEAAVALASQPGTHVTVIHRGEGFSRGKSRNVSELQALAARKKIDLRFSTELAAVGPTEVTLRRAEDRENVRVDAIFVLIGGVPSWDLLARAGVKILSESGS
jgi:thioredoxin reductase